MATADWGGGPSLAINVPPYYRAVQARAQRQLDEWGCRAKRLRLADRLDRAIERGLRIGSAVRLHDLPRATLVNLAALAFAEQVDLERLEFDSGLRTEEAWAARLLSTVGLWQSAAAAASWVAWRRLCEGAAQQIVQAATGTERSHLRYLALEAPPEDAQVEIVGQVVGRAQRQFRQSAAWEPADLQQEAWLRLEAVRRQLGAGPSHDLLIRSAELGGLVHAVAKNRLLDLARQESRRPQVGQGLDILEAVDGPLRRAPFATHAEVELRLDLREALCFLSPRQQQIVGLLHFGYTQVEIAGALSVSPQAINQAMDRIRLSLAEHLGPAYGEYFARLSEKRGRNRGG